MIRPSVRLSRLRLPRLLSSPRPRFSLRIRHPHRLRSGASRLRSRSPPQIDLNLINLPTTMSIARHRSYFRLTHRFASDLRRGDFGDQAADLFSLDKGAIIGLEYRFGITSNIQAGVHRSLLSKTIQTFGRWDALAPGRLAARLGFAHWFVRRSEQPPREASGRASPSRSRARSAIGWRCMRRPRSWADTHAVDFIAGS